MEVVEQRAADLGATELALDTSEAATHLIRFYANRRYRFIEHIQHEGKNYRSSVFSKTLMKELHEIYPHRTEKLNMRGTQWHSAQFWASS
jgi:hypothetical protein